MKKWKKIITWILMEFRRRRGISEATNKKMRKIEILKGNKADKLKVLQMKIKKDIKMRI